MRRRVELDGIRAFAVLAVFVDHTAYAQTAGPSFLGVNVFFVLSGFLITTLLLQEHQETGMIDYPAFYLRRILRLYPALVVACALTAVLSLFAHDGSDLDSTIFALMYITDFTTSHGLWLAHTWSLGVEEQFYLVWPALRVCLSSRWNLRQALPAIVISLALVPAFTAAAFGGPTAQYTPLGAAYQLMAGAAIAVMPIRVPRGTWVAIVAVYLLVDVVEPGRAIQYGLMQLFTLVSALTVIWALQFRPRILINRPVVWLGQRSYGFYLYHRPILIFLAQEIHSRLAQTAVGLLLSLGVTAASYRLVERPFLRRRIAFRRVPAKGLAVSTAVS